MGIDYKSLAKQVIAKKEINPVKQKFDFLKADYNTQNLFEYTSFIQDLPLRDIFENTQYIFSEPLYGAKFFNFFMEANYFTTDQLESQKEVLENHLEKCKTARYDNKPHLESMNDSLSIINNELSRREDISYIREDLKYTYHMDKLYPVMESEVNDELDKMVNSVSSNPANIGKYEAFIAELKKKKTVNAIKYFPLLLVKNTSIVLGIMGAAVGTVAMSIGVAMTVCLAVPPFIVASLVGKGVNKGVANSYIAIIDKQIAIIHDKMNKEPDITKKKNLSAYLNVLMSAKTSLHKYTSSQHGVKESMTQILEGAVLFIAPYVLPIPKRWIMGFLHTGWDIKEKVIMGDIEKMNNQNKIIKLIDNMQESKRFYQNLDRSKTMEAKILKFAAFNGVNADKAMDSILELHDHTIELLKKRLAEVKRGKRYVKESSIGSIVTESAPETSWMNFVTVGEDEADGEDEDDEDEDDEDDINDDEVNHNDFYASNLYSDDLYDMMEDPNSKLNSCISADLMENFLAFIFTDEDVDMLESFNNLLTLGNTISYITEAREVINAARKTKDFSDKIDTKVNKAVEPVNNFVSQTIDSVKKVDNRERRNRLIEGKFRFRLLKIIRNAVMLGGIWAINPAIAAITFLVGVALDAKADSKIRAQILDELKEELKIVEEKIDDAKSDSERQKKYELMRIKNKLEKDIKRIEFRLDHAS